MTLHSDRPWWQEISLAIFLLVPTLYFGNEYYGLILPVLVVWYDFEKWKGYWKAFWVTPFNKNHIKYVWLTAAFCLLALLNKIFNGGSIYCSKDYYSPFFLLPILLITAAGIFSNRLLQLIILFVSIECIVSWFEYYFHVRTFFEPLREELIIKPNDTLYYSHVYGFTTNSSMFALHLLIAYILLSIVNFKPYFHWIIFAILFTGLVTSFNRTLIITLLFFFVIDLLIKLYSNRRKLNTSIVFKSSIACLAFSLFYFSPIVQENFNRGNSEQLAYNPTKIQQQTVRPKINCTEKHAVEMLEPNQLDTSKVLTQKLLTATANYNTSGRKLIWINYLNEIESRPWFGNGSNKLMLRTIQPITGKVELFHAHNSYLMLFSTYGIPLAIFFLICLFCWWTKRNFAILLAILFYSMLQYGIFWGFSFLDIIFMFFLITPSNNTSFGHQATDKAN